MTKARSRFVIKQKILEQVVLAVYRASQKGQGIFDGGWEVWKNRSLPQYNLPIELEFSPRRLKPKDPKAAAQFLWQKEQYERRNVSKFLHQCLPKIWYNPELNWIFDPVRVAQATLEQIENITKNHLHYNLKGKKERPVPERIKSNACLLVDRYGGDPRKIIDGKTVEQARQALKDFAGIGSGIANMTIMEFMDRGLVQILDPENLLFKVDVHKGRIPINTHAVQLVDGYTSVHVDDVAPKLERAYHKAYTKLDIDPVKTDAALWVLGSRVCVKRSYATCIRYCPLAHSGLCKQNVPLGREKGDSSNGRFVVIDKHGKPAETRRDLPNTHNGHSGQRQEFIPGLHSQFFS